MQFLGLSDLFLSAGANTTKPENASDLEKREHWKDDDGERRQSEPVYLERHYPKDLVREFVALTQGCGISSASLPSYS